MFHTNMQIRLKNTGHTALQQNSTNFSSMISVSGQTIFYGGRAVDTVLVDNALYWENGDEKGCLWLYHHGLCAHGYLIQNGTKNELDVQCEDAIFPLTYKNANGSTIISQLHIGTRNNPETGGFLEYGALYFQGEKVFESFQCDEEGNIKAGQIDNGFLQSTFDGQLRFLISLSSLWDALGAEMVHDFIGPDFNVYDGVIDISPDYSRVSGGSVTEQLTQVIDNVQITGRGKKYELQTVNQTLHIINPAEKILSSSRKNELTEAFHGFGDSPMSITELFTLPAPDMYASNQKATEILYYLTIAWVGDQTYSCGGQSYKWSNWFGMTKETAEARIKDVDYRILDLIGTNADKRVIDFLQKYAKATLSNSYVSASSTDPTLLDALLGAKSRMTGDKSYCTLPALVSYYLQGSGDTCLSKDPGYCIAMEEINKCVYAKLTPKLINYLENEPQSWAEKLYKQCCSNLQLLKITSVSGEKGSSEISHKTTMLNLLDNIKHDGIITNAKGTSTPITYGAALYAKVFNLQLSEIADLLGDGYLEPGSANYLEMMRHIYGVMFEELQKEWSDFFTPDILKVFQDEMKAFLDLTQELYIQTCLEMTEAGLSMLSQGATLTSVIPKIKSLSAKPWASFCSAGVSIVMYA